MAYYVQNMIIVMQWYSYTIYVVQSYFHLCRIVEKTISSAYSTYCQTHHKITRNIDTHMMDASSVSSPSYLVDLPKEFFQMLAACGPYLHRDTQLFQKVSLDLFCCILLVLVPAQYRAALLDMLEIFFVAFMS